jgi:ribosome-binding factor A
MSKEKKLGEIIKHYLAELIVGEVDSPTFLITITRVECPSDLKLAKVFISVLPENFSGTALKNLRNKSSFLSKELKKRANLNKNPKLQWSIDNDLKRAFGIEEILEEIKREE